MVHLFWDFAQKELKDLDPLKRVEFVNELQRTLKIPVGYTAGFDKPYIEIEHDDPISNHPMFKANMIPRAGYITRVAVRHLTHQSEEYVEQIRTIANRLFNKPETTRKAIRIMK